MRELAYLIKSCQLLTPDQLDDAVQSQAIFGDSLDTNLLELGFLTEDQLQPLLEQVYSVRNRVDVRTAPYPEALLLLKWAQAQKYKLVPYRIEGRVLDVVLSDPRDVKSLDEVAFATGCRIVPNVATEARVAWHLFRGYHVPMPERLHATFAVQARLKPPTIPPSMTAYRASRVAKQQGYPEPVDAGIKIGWTDPPSPPVPAPAPAAVRARPTTLPPVDLNELLPHIPPPAAPPPVPPVLDVIETDADTDTDISIDVDMSSSSPVMPAAAPEAPEAASSYEGVVWTGLDSLAKFFAEVSTREEIPHIVFGLLAPRVTRIVLFSVNRGRAIGWDARGGRLRKETVETIVIPLDRESIFRRVVEGGKPFIGELPLDSVEETFVVKLGSVMAPNIFVWPVRVRERTVALLYGEPPGSITTLGVTVQAVVDQMEATFLRLILERKKDA